MRKWLKEKWRWLRKNLLNREMLIFTLIGESIFWIPVWIPAVIAIMTRNNWWWTVSGGAIAFWSGPFTPAILLQLGLIFLLKVFFGSGGTLKEKWATVKAKFEELKKKYLKETTEDDND